MNEPISSPNLTPADGGQGHVPGKRDKEATLEDNKELGPCAAHATINCLQCFDIDLEDLDEDGNLIVVDGQSVIDATARAIDFLEAFTRGAYVVSKRGATLSAPPPKGDSGKEKE
jgi:hypothetical protein